MTGKVVIVTGGGRGIGRAICERFASAGAQVVAASRSAKELKETSSAIESSGGKCHSHVTDVGNSADLQKLIADTVSRFGRVDVLVNCAGVAPKAPFDQMEPVLFDTIRAVNIDAVYHACRFVWPIMKKQGGGVIITISSIASADPFPGFAAYGASKAWLNLWTRALAEEGRPQNIRVFAVAPGAVETRMLRDAFPTFPSDQTLLPSDVAGAVFGLCGEDFRYATGETVFVKKS